MAKDVSFVESLFVVLERPRINDGHKSLRKHPPVMFLRRQCTKLFELKNGAGKVCRIEPKTSIIIPTYAIHNDPKYYQDPEIFDPERFSEENIQNRPKYTYLPFGEGPRICLARSSSQQSTPNTLKTHSKHTQDTLKTHSKHTSNTLKTHSKHTQDTLKTHSKHTQDTLQTHFKHTQDTLKTHSKHTQDTLKTHSKHTQDTLQIHSRHRKELLPLLQNGKHSVSYLLSYIAPSSPTQWQAFCQLPPVLRSYFPFYTLTSILKYRLTFFKPQEFLKKDGFIKKENDEGILTEAAPAIDNWEEVPAISYVDFVNVDEDVAACGEVSDADTVSEVLNNNIQDKDRASGGEEDNSSVVQERPIPSVAEAMEPIQELRRPLKVNNKLKDVLLSRIDLEDVFEMVYSELEGHELGGFYQFLQPCLMVRSPDVIETILVTRFDCFHDNWSHVCHEVDPLASRSLFFMTGDRGIYAPPNRAVLPRLRPSQSTLFHPSANEH
uniref:Cytochrome P450 n=1 Tax=Timema douglasi TaxID=61478 RepID=A0A7R8VUH3_TIMDO|nr:unnamed protein product [Timema douglasi]